MLCLCAAAAWVAAACHLTVNSIDAEQRNAFETNFLVCTPPSPSSPLPVVAQDSLKPMLLRFPVPVLIMCVSARRPLSAVAGEGAPQNQRPGDCPGAAAPGAQSVQGAAALAHGLRAALPVPGALAWLDRASYALLACCFTGVVLDASFDALNHPGNRSFCCAQNDEIDEHDNDGTGAV